MDVRSQPTIIVELAIKNGKADERVSYTNHETARERKKVLQGLIQARKKERGHGDGKGPDHSEDFDHDSWVTKPGEIVVFRCRNYFKLFVDYDTHVCPPVAGAPQNPFDWDGLQEAELGPDGYEVRGTAVRDQRVFNQMFYKFTAYIEGISEPLDPEGICGSDG
jgi:hypothetical protein